MTIADLLHEDGRARLAAAGLDPEPFLAAGRALARDLAGGAGDDVRRAAWGWLDLLRRGGLPVRLAEREGGVATAWPLVLEILRASRYTLATLLAQRVEAYGPRPLFLRPGAAGTAALSWRDAAAQVDGIARGLAALAARHGARPVAFLSENRIEMALADLACLTTGQVDVMVPATVGDSEAGDVLSRVAPGVVFVSGPELAARIERLRPGLPSIHTVIDFDDPHPAAGGTMGLPELLERGTAIGDDRLLAAREAVDPRAVATVMFTSGTTGRSKGIQFSIENLVAKRFARGLALPAIGDRDTFLCYLPLFHTFGRYLEMLGAIYWGATYVALPDPSVETLLDGFARARPSVFISIPRRWMQLHEEVARRIDLDRADPALRRETIRAVVGDRLRWGLSAAGYLPAEVFRFFQDAGIELMSGFGMTEATGGITMTPPGGYRDDSLGLPLPGIELRLESDGELSIRGPYVMVGYHGEADSGLDPDGWLRTGDLFERDAAGHYRLVDRKKEIYKNSKGQTIAPQKIENLFRDVPAVHRAFLVGDHREYNTVLLVPDPAFAETHLAGLSPDERREAFRTVLAAVNRFLAPYERIVDYALLDRDFSEANGELTPKGTYRRPQIAQNFAPVIDLMYRRTRLRLAEDGPGLIFNNWLFQALARTAGDVRFEDGTLEILPTGATLRVGLDGRDGEAWRVRLGSNNYLVRGNTVDLGLFVACPPLWLGNDELVRFAPVEPSVRLRRQRRPLEITPLGRTIPYEATRDDLAQLRAALAQGAIGLPELDLAARLVGSMVEEHAALGLEVVRHALARPDDLPPELARLALRGAASSPSRATRRAALLLLWPVERDENARATFEHFLAAGPALLDGPTAAALGALDAGEAKLEALVRLVRRAVRDPKSAAADHLEGLVALLARHGADHPSRYQRVRWVLAFVEAHAPGSADRDAAHRARREMSLAFRAWLGNPPGPAIDPDTRREYRWPDVVLFAEDVPDADRARLLDAFATTAVLREAVFLFSGGVTIRLADIVPGGVRVARTRSLPGRSVYRVTVETRWYGTFEIAVHLVQGLGAAVIEHETLWLITTGELRGDARRRDRLVPEFGGIWRDQQLWTEEFVHGPTVLAVVERLVAPDNPAGHERLPGLWPFLAWTAAEAFIEFSARTGGERVIERPGPDVVVVPTHDYQVGPRLLSIAPHAAYHSAAAVLRALEEHFVAPLVALHPPLAAVPVLPLLASAILEVVGVDYGLEVLEEASRDDARLAQKLRAFVESVRRNGFVPRRLFFAIERYRRWLAVAPDPTREAQAFTIRQLKETYGLADVYDAYPEARTRFFRETVLRGAAGALGEGLDLLIDGLRRREFAPREVPDRVEALREFAAPGSADEYFLVRLSWPHVRPGDAAGLISHERGGVRSSEVVISCEDARGRHFRVRRPLSTKEVGDLHRLFLAARLPVSFRPDHHFLVALEPTGRLIGGLFYEHDAAAARAHLEKIVVAEPWRQLGVSNALMNEFLHRLQAAGVKVVTTGFFRPEYFAHFGFKVDRSYGGQVKTLEPAGA